MHQIPEHINQDIKRRESKDKDSTVNKTEYWTMSSIGFSVRDKNWDAQLLY